MLEISQKISMNTTNSKYLLMTLPENKYKTLLRAGEWKAPDEDQKEFLALRAQFEDLKKKKDNNHDARMNWKKKAPSDPKATKTLNQSLFPETTMEQPNYQPDREGPKCRSRYKRSRSPGSRCNRTRC